MAGLIPAIHVFTYSDFIIKAWMPGTRPGMTTTLELHRRTQAREERVLHRRIRVRRIRHAPARAHDVLNVGLNRPPRRNLRDITRFQHKLVVADRIRRAVEGKRIAVETGGVAADLGVGRAKRENVVVATAHEPFEANAAIDVPGQEIAVRRRRARTQEEAHRLLTVSPEHLVDHAVNAPVAAMIERPDNSRIGERYDPAEAIYAQALIGVIRGRVPAAELVGAGEAC